MKTFGSKAKKTLGIVAIVAMIPAAGFASGRLAIEACEDLNEGDMVQFTTPRGDTVSGICRDLRGQLIAVPEGGFPGKHRGKGPGKRFARMARKLDLTEAQQEQVRTLLESERERVASLRKQLAETREKIRQATLAETFDEAAVRALAVSQSEARVELAVSRARVKSQIHALLTPEQRERAKTFRSEGKGRHGHRPWR